MECCRTEMRSTAVSISKLPLKRIIKVNDFSTKLPDDKDNHHEQVESHQHPGVQRSSRGETALFCSGMVTVPVESWINGVQHPADIQLLGNELGDLLD